MRTIRKAYWIFNFTGYYLFSIVKANLYLAWDVLTPKMLINPGIITIKLMLESKSALLLFSNLVSMTPGTLVIDLDPEKNEAVVHVLYLRNEKAIRSEIYAIQCRIKRIFE
ncbi:MAG: Na+/H+ antiporter subunit E [Bacteroidales bacterium]|nr:Na+/H+ antiporter subunit E [Bacteroidales bacterium]